MKHYDPLRVEWDCRRGMLELDKVIMPFYKQHFEQLNEHKKAMKLFQVPSQINKFYVRI